MRCCILISPFLCWMAALFGSRTKLFEYMAMAMAIVASALGQIANVLEHGRTTLLVRPGELSEAIQRLQPMRKFASSLDETPAKPLWRSKSGAGPFLAYCASNDRTSTDSSGLAVGSSDAYDPHGA